MGIRTVVRLAAAREAQSRQPLPDSALGWGHTAWWADAPEMAGVEFDPLTASRLAWTVDRRAAMSIAAVARGRSLICSTVGRFPLIGFNRQAEPLQPQPSWVRQPEVGRPRFITYTWTVDAMLFYGRAFWLKLDNAGNTTAGLPDRFMWVPEWSAGTDQYGRLNQAFGDDVNPAHSVRIDAPHEGFLNYGADRIREAQAVDRAASHASDNPVPSVELHQTGGDPLTREQIADLTSNWIAARRIHGVGYTNQSVTMIPHGQAAEQLLIDGRNQAALNIARAMNLPAWAVDASVDGSSLTYSNTPSRSRELIDYTLAPYMTAIEQRLGLNDVSPNGQWVRFDTTDLLRGDFAARMDAYAVAVNAGIYTAEEVRQMETGTAIEENSIHA